MTKGNKKGSLLPSDKTDDHVPTQSIFGDYKYQMPTVLACNACNQKNKEYGECLSIFLACDYECGKNNPMVIEEIASTWNKKLLPSIEKSIKSIRRVWRFVQGKSKAQFTSF